MDIFIPCLPMVAQFFAVPISQAQWVLSIYFIGAGLGQLLLGPLSDRYGRRPVILTSIFIVGLASVACTYAKSIAALTLLRLLQGIGASGTTVVVVAIIRDLYEDHITPRVYSHLSAIIGLAPLFAPYIGGSLLVWSGTWHSVFYFVAIYCLLTWLLAFKYITETSPKHSKHIPNNLSLEMAAELGGGSGKIRGTIKNYKRILRDREFIKYGFCAVAGLSGLFLFFSISSVLLIDKLGISADKFGVYFGTNSLVYMLANALSPKLQKRVSIDRVIEYGIYFVLLGAIAMLIIALTSDLSALGLIIPNCIITLGIGLLYGPCAAGAMKKYKAIAGTASAIYGALIYCSSALVVTIVMQFEIKSTIPLASTVLIFALSSYRILRLPR
jgi:DHA1 family bicyclomycin/chloramphenicol resistance-like MFS transporter